MFATALSRFDSGTEHFLFYYITFAAKPSALLYGDEQSF